jgi:hypothetical protein
VDRDAACAPPHASTCASRRSASRSSFEPREELRTRDQREVHVRAPAGRPRGQRDSSSSGCSPTTTSCSRSRCRGLRE